MCLLKLIKKNEEAALLVVLRWWKDGNHSEDTLLLTRMIFVKYCGGSLDGMRPGHREC